MSIQIVVGVNGDKASQPPLRDQIEQLTGDPPVALKRARVGTRAARASANTPASDELKPNESDTERRRVAQAAAAGAGAGAASGRADKRACRVRVVLDGLKQEKVCHIELFCDGLNSGADSVHGRFGERGWLGGKDHELSAQQVPAQFRFCTQANRWAVDSSAATSRTSQFMASAGNSSVQHQAQASAQAALAARKDQPHAMPVALPAAEQRLTPPFVAGSSVKARFSSTLGGHVCVPPRMPLGQVPAPPKTAAGWWPPPPLRQSLTMRILVAIGVGALIATVLGLQSNLQRPAHPKDPAPLACSTKPSLAAAPNLCGKAPDPSSPG